MRKRANPFTPPPAPMAITGQPLDTVHGDRDGPACPDTAMPLNRKSRRQGTSATTLTTTQWAITPTHGKELNGERRMASRSVTTRGNRRLVTNRVDRQPATTGN